MTWNRHFAFAQSGGVPLPLEPGFHSWAESPPMGWSSWFCFGTTVTEKQILQQTDFMAEKLKGHGWEYMVVDTHWYQHTATAHDYKEDAELAPTRKTQAPGPLSGTSLRSPMCFTGTDERQHSDRPPVVDLASVSIEASSATLS